MLLLELQTIMKQAHILFFLSTVNQISTHDKRTYQKKVKVHYPKNILYICTIFPSIIIYTNKRQKGELIESIQSVLIRKHTHQKKTTPFYVYYICLYRVSYNHYHKSSPSQYKTHQISLQMQINIPKELKVSPKFRLM